jgi:hypothetical protein
VNNDYHFILKHHDLNPSHKPVYDENHALTLVPHNLEDSIKHAYLWAKHYIKDDDLKYRDVMTEQLLRATIDLIHFKIFKNHCE